MKHGCSAFFFEEVTSGENSTIAVVQSRCAISLWKCDANSGWGLRCHPQGAESDPGSLVVRGGVWYQQGRRKNNLMEESKMKTFWSVVAASALGFAVSFTAQAYSNCDLSAYNQGGYGQSLTGYCSISEPFAAYDGYAPTVSLQIRGRENGELVTVLYPRPLPVVYDPNFGNRNSPLVYWDPYSNGNGTIYGSVPVSNVNNFRSRTVDVFLVINGQREVIYSSYLNGGSPYPSPGYPVPGYPTPGYPTPGYPTPFPPSPFP